MQTNDVKSVVFTFLMEVQYWWSITLSVSELEKENKLAVALIKHIKWGDLGNWHINRLLINSKSGTQVRIKVNEKQCFFFILWHYIKK